MDPSETCSAISRAVGEPLLGTAPTAREWLLVEHPGPWERDPVNSLPSPARDAVRSWLATGSRRLQLIRRPSRRPDGEGVLAVRADLAERRLVGVRLPALASLSIPWRGEQLIDAMVLVCVHGRRDRCCAEHGKAVSAALAGGPLARDLWETTHLGGHRFAATVALLPSGRVLGRLTPTVAAAAIDDARTGHSTPFDRGRAGLAEQDQVAEVLGSARRGDAVVRPASCDAEPELVEPWVGG